MACIFDEDNIQLNIQFDNKYDASRKNFTKQRLYRT